MPTIYGLRRTQDRDATKGNNYRQILEGLKTVIGSAVGEFHPYSFRRADNQRYLFDESALLTQGRSPESSPAPLLTLGANVNPNAPASGDPRITARFVNHKKWVEVLNKLLQTNATQDAEDFEQPNRTAVSNARKILEECRTIGVFPQRLAASVEGGVGITFSAQDRMGYIEADNDGNIVAGHYSDAVDPCVWEVASNSQEVYKAVKSLIYFVNDSDQPPRRA